MDVVRGRAGLGYLAAAPVLFGGSGAAARMLSRTMELSSLQLASARVLIGGCGLLAAAVLLRRPPLRGADARRRVMLMALLSVVFQAGFFAAVLWGSISVATLLTLGSAPVFVTAAQAWRTRHVSWSTLAILALALTGLGLLVGTAAPGTGLSLPVVGSALAAGAAFGSMTLINAIPIPRADPLRATALAFLFAGGILAVAAQVAPGPAVRLPTPDSAAWLLILGLACTAAPYGLYFTGLLKSSASVGALFALLEPLTATLIAVVAFGETLSPPGWIGAVLLLFALAFGAVKPAAGPGSGGPRPGCS